MAYTSKYTGEEIDGRLDSLDGIQENLNNEINTINQNILNLENNITQNINSVWETVYPVGSIYFSASSTSPASLFGGTWTQLKDRVLMGAGDSYAVNATGGAETHTHTSAAHTHTVAGHTHSTVAVTLNINQIPSHGHGVGYKGSNGNYVPQNSTQFLSFRTGSTTYTPAINGVLIDIAPDGYTTTNFIQSSGGGASHSHGNTGSTSLTTNSTTPGATGSSSSLPPYLAVYMWKRTA